MHILKSTHILACIKITYTHPCTYNESLTEQKLNPFYTSSYIHRYTQVGIIIIILQVPW